MEEGETEKGSHGCVEWGGGVSRASGDLRICRLRDGELRGNFLQERTGELEAEPSLAS